MSVCYNCGQDKKSFEMNYEKRKTNVEGACFDIEVGICDDCKKILSSNDINNLFIKKAEEELKIINKEANELKLLEKFPSTTSNYFEGYRITEYLGIKSGEVVLGTGFLSELSGKFNDFLGTNSDVLSDKMAQAKLIALNKLKKKCLDTGANAVIGVDIDFMTIGENMFCASANGTAVVIEKIEGV